MILGGGGIYYYISKTNILANKLMNMSYSQTVTVIKNICLILFTHKVSVLQWHHSADL